MKDGVGRFVNVLYRQLIEEQKRRKNQYLENFYGIMDRESDL